MYPKNDWSHWDYEQEIQKEVQGSKIMNRQKILATILANRSLSIRRESITSWSMIHMGCDYEGGSTSCDNCDVKLDMKYVEVIERLKALILLEQDYPMLCCTCFFVSRYREGSRCPWCNDTLDGQIKHNEIQILCHNIKCDFIEAYKLLPEDRKYLDDFYRDDEYLKRMREKMYGTAFEWLFTIERD